MNNSPTAADFSATSIFDKDPDFLVDHKGPTSYFQDVRSTLTLLWAEIRIKSTRIKKVVDVAATRIQEYLIRGSFVKHLMKETISYSLKPKFYGGAEDSHSCVSYYIYQYFSHNLADNWFAERLAVL